MEFTSDLDVELIQFTGGDEFVSAAARVSTAGWDSLPDTESSGLIRFLMRNRHGSPFEHGLFTWRVSAPIFVWREIMRHRIASYNEESGRYKQLEPKFYIPDSNRNLVQTGKVGEYKFEPGTKDQAAIVETELQIASVSAYEKYDYLLRTGIAKEVARMCLPVNIYSSAWISMNPRALMNFLSLRTTHEESAFKSTPMHEINVVADKMGASMATHMPYTYGIFRELGSVAP